MTLHWSVTHEALEEKTLQSKNVQVSVAWRIEEELKGQSELVVMAMTRMADSD